LFRNVLLGEAVLEEEVSDVSDHAESKRFLASDESEGTGEVLNHKVSGCSHFRFVSFHGEILHRQLSSRDTGDSDGTFNDGSNDLANGSVNSDTNQSTKGVVRGEERKLSIEDDVIR